MARDDPGYLDRGQRRPSVQVVGPAWACEAASGPTALQYGVAVAALLAILLLVCRDTGLALALLHSVFLIVFTLAVIWRGLATAIAEPPRRIARIEDASLAPYTVIVPLYREAAMVPGLMAALAALDYPTDRLQIIVVLEADDDETRVALSKARGANRVQILIAPPGVPKTKPRACNIALAQASGRHVVVYDAEDRPHRLQLREAAARFAIGGDRLACLQAPLRIAGAQRFLSRQFALEYAAQFEVVLPALARLGAPFPLGGTSNHFQTAVLKSVGGWDAWNVTEDADLGFRLAARGWRLGFLRTPTWESAPARFKDWRPQRTRWVKGYMQTWGVHMRAPLRGGWRRFLTLQATLGLAILSALAHGPVMLALLANAAVLVAQGRSPTPAAADLALLVGGWGGAILTMSSGARRAGLSMRLSDAAGAPLYWALQSFAALHSIAQLVTRPHHWDKTRHEPPRNARIGVREPAPRAAGLDGKGAASVRRAA